MPLVVVVPFVAIVVAIFAVGGAISYARSSLGRREELRARRDLLAEAIASAQDTTERENQ